MFVSDHLDEKERKAWLSETWPEILLLAEKKKVYILFRDEVSVPKWGTLSYTWSRQGKQPTIGTCGIRKGYKVFGLIDYLKFPKKASRRQAQQYGHERIYGGFVGYREKHTKIIIHGGFSH